MANEEQLSILKQGVDVWNKWREENPDEKIDLTESNLRSTNLVGANFRSAIIDKADVRVSFLRGADLTNAKLRGSTLNFSDLSETILTNTDLSGAFLERANLSGAYLLGATLKSSKLIYSTLRRAVFSGSLLNGADFLKAEFGRTVFALSDLSQALNLSDTYHGGPSTIGADTIVNSKGQIPDKFLRDCGLSDIQIEFSKLYDPNITNEEIIKIQYRIYDLRATQAIQISPLFISYSHADNVFVDKIETHLNIKGIRFWRDIHDMKAGRMEKQIDHALRLNPTVLLVLSKESLQSDWVEHEVRTARILEKEMKKDVLCPIAIDDSWKNSPWSKRVMEQVMEYNILDFSAWKDDSKFGIAFNKLIDGLELFYK